MSKVLICDDEAFFREAVGEILRQEGFDVLEAEGGAQALDLVARHGVGVVVAAGHCGGEGLQVAVGLVEQLSHCPSPPPQAAGPSSILGINPPHKQRNG